MESFFGPGSLDGENSLFCQGMLKRYGGVLFSYILLLLYALWGKTKMFIFPCSSMLICG